MLKKILMLMVSLGCSYWGYAQESRYLPFLEINPDVRAAAMGNSTMGEARGMYLYSNPTSLLNEECTKRIYSSYTFAFLPKINDDRERYHAFSAGLRLFDRHALMVGFRYIGGLSVNAVDANGNPRSAIKPNDWSIDLAYAFKFNDRWSAYLGGSFIQSKLDKSSYLMGANGGVYYKSQCNRCHRASYTLGLGFSNIGGATMKAKGISDLKMPGSVSAGGSMALPFNKNHRLNATLSTRYFMIPSSAATLTTSLGLEYELFDRVAVRTGYFMDGDVSANNYFSMGVGLRCKFGSIDAAYAMKKNKDFNVIRLGVSFQM